MNNKEKDLSEYIDSLNEERKPKAHKKQTKSVEQEDLYKVVRVVRGLKEPVLPDDNYKEKLVANLADKLSKKAYEKKRKRSWFVGAGAVAAVVFFVMMLNFILPFERNNIVYAMDQAYKEVTAYHGFIEVVTTNAEGNNTTQAELEVWMNREGNYYVKVLKGVQEGLITVNNGQKKWQIRPESKEVYILPTSPDPYRFVFEMGKEIEEIKSAPGTKVIGEETIAGRNATVMEISPDGGLPYQIWIDNESKLPLQKQSAMQNALQYTMTYTKLEFEDSVPSEFVSYNLPEGFSEINTRPEQTVTGLEEAQSLAGFIPLAPQDIPEEYKEESITVETNTNIVNFNFKTQDNSKKVTILEMKVDGEFKPASMAVLGKIGGSTAEIQSPVQYGSGVLGGGLPYAGVSDISSIRWQSEEIEYAVVGNVPLEDLILFVRTVTDETVDISLGDEESLIEPEVVVPVDLEVEKNEQKSVDAGHSPWRLDPAYVAQVFVSLKISPDGIVGEYPIEYDSLEIIKNNGIDTVVQVAGEATPITRVYLKRLIRQDTTGIWTVIGYDSEGGV